jgi:hypothetical protein
VARLINDFVSQGSIVIRDFQTRKGFRQGDLLSPMLFNIAADMFAILIERAKLDGQIDRVIPHLVDGG